MGNNLCNYYTYLFFLTPFLYYSDKIALIRAPHLANKFEESTVKFEGKSDSDLSSFIKENL